MWLEKKYISMLSNQLHMFKHKGPELWNFRCPYCNDSTKSKSKTRGYIYNKNGRYVFYCHNCNASRSLEQFIREQNNELYRDYNNERFNLTKPDPIVVPPKQVYQINDQLKTLRKISSLNSSHPCKQYVVSRQIPTDYHYKLFYCPKFKDWVNSIIPGKFDQEGKDSPRLIIPFLDQDEKMFGFQGRALTESKVKYITIMLDERKPRIFGLDTVDYNRKIYCFEGPIDSMFVENAIATCGGHIHMELKKSSLPKDNIVVCYDNEPRNKDVVRNMLKSCREGYKVFVWPNSIDTKDINDLVLKKIKADYCKTELIKKLGEYIKDVIDSNTYSGLELELIINNWRKI